MNIIFFGFQESNSIQDTALKEFLQDNKSKINSSYLIGKSRKKKIIKKDTIQFIPTKYISHSCKKFSKKIIPSEIKEELKKHLEEFNYIYYRLFFRFKYFPSDKNSHKVFYSLSHYSYHFIINNNISHVFFSNIPHEGIDYVFYIIAKKLNIKITITYQIILPDTIFTNNSIESIFDNLQKKEKYNKNLPYDYEEIYNGLVENKSPFYIKKNNIYLKFLRENLKLLKFPIRPKRTLYRHLYPSLIFLKNTYDFIKSSHKTFDLTQKFIYFPLHYDPELTVCPLGGKFFKQQKAIEVLSHSVPKNIQIIIKEHPTTLLNPKVSFFRRNKFYSQLNKLGNVIILRQNFSAFELIEKSLAIATITGTTGWEGILRNKPILLFGNIFYKYFPKLVYQIDSVNSCKKAIQSIEHFIPLNKNELKKMIQQYLISINNTTEQTIIDNDYLPISKISPDIAKNNLKKIFIQNII